MVSQVVHTYVVQYSTAYNDLQQGLRNIFAIADTASHGDDPQDGMTVHSDAAPRDVAAEVDELIKKCNAFEELRMKMAAASFHVEQAEAEQVPQKRRYYVLISLSVIVFAGTLAYAIANGVLDASANVKASGAVLSAIAVVFLVLQGITQCQWFGYDNAKDKKDELEKVPAVDREDLHNLLTALREWKTGLQNPDHDMQSCFGAIKNSQNLSQGTGVNLEEVCAAVIDSLPPTNPLKNMAQDIYDIAQNKTVPDDPRISSEHIHCSMPLSRRAFQERNSRMSRSMEALRGEKGTIKNHEGSDSDTLDVKSTLTTPSAAPRKIALAFTKEMDTATQPNDTQPKSEAWQVELARRFQALQSQMSFQPDFLIMRGKKISAEGLMQAYVPTPRREHHHTITINEVSG